MTGLVVLWTCLCIDATNDPTDTLPARCPGHDRPRASQWRNTRHGGVTPGHECPPDHLCPQETP